MAIDLRDFQRHFDLDPHHLSFVEGDVAKFPPVGSLTWQVAQKMATILQVAVWVKEAEVQKYRVGKDAGFDPVQPGHPRILHPEVMRRTSSVFVRQGDRFRAEILALLRAWGYDFPETGHAGGIRPAVSALRAPIASPAPEPAAAKGSSQGAERILFPAAAPVPPLALSAAR